MMNTWVGLDVSKDSIEVCLLRESGKEHFKQFPNDDGGHLKLLRWTQHLAPDVAVHFCLEATGSYSNAVALFLAEAEQAVSVLNPARIHFFARCQGQGNKTDKADARIIALFCRKEQPELWRAAAPEVRELVALVRRYHAVLSRSSRPAGPREKSSASTLPAQSRAVLSEDDGAFFGKGNRAS